MYKRQCKEKIIEKHKKEQNEIKEREAKKCSNALTSTYTIEDVQLTHVICIGKWVRIRLYIVEGGVVIKIIGNG